MLKLKLNARRLLMITAVTTLAASTALVGCGQRARIRLPAPGPESTIEAGQNGKKSDTPKLTPTPAGDAVAAPTLKTNEELIAGIPFMPALDEVAAEGPLAGPATEATTAALVGAVDAAQGGVRLYGAKGAKLLEKLRVSGKAALLAFDKATKETKKAGVRVNHESENLLSRAWTEAMPTGGSAEEKAYCFLFRGDSRVNQSSSLIAECPKDQKALSVAEGKKLKVGKMKVHPCSDIRTVARFHEDAWKASDALVDDLLKHNDDFKEIHSVLSGGKTNDDVKTSGTKADAMNFYVSVNEAHKQNNESAKAIIAIAKAAKCSLKKLR